VSSKSLMSGMKWWCYQTTRSKEDIEADYQVPNLSKGDHLVRDVWTRGENIVYVDDHRAKAAGHSYGEVPCLYVKVPFGAMLADPRNAAHEGESILQMNRNLWPEMNRSVTVLQTLNMMTFTAGYLYKNEEGVDAELPDKDPRRVRGGTSIGIHESIEPVAIQDMRNSTRHLLAILEGRLQRGSLTALDFGNLTFPLSAVAIARLTEGRDQIFVPRIQGIAMYYQRLLKMIIRQILSKGLPITIGPPESRREFKPSDLEGEYTIKFRYFSESPEQVIANYAVADAARQAGLPQHDIMRDILKVPDPTGTIMRRRAEDAEALDPVVKLYRYIVTLIEQGQDLEAKLMKPTLFNMVRQRMAGPMPEAAPAVAAGAATPQLPQGGQGLVPLLAAGSGGGGRRNPQLEDAAEQAIAEEEDRQQMAEINRGRRQREGADG
ncbi:MAG: hypothetical protein ACYSVY_11040, partial [Planctomycetota bacterium]